MHPNFKLLTLRFIPVYTGNIPSSIFTKLKYSVYPCVYREHPSSGWTVSANSGLSLCIQGTLPAVHLLFLIVRFISVYTGNIMNSCIMRKNWPVYPCVYREHNYTQNLAVCQSGLSLCIQGT